MMTDASDRPVRICGFPTKAGTPCQAPVLDGKARCFFHDDSPETVAARRAARAAGGHNTRKALQPGTVPDKIENASDLLHLLDETVRGVASGAICTQVGNTIAQLARAFISTAEASEIKTILAKLERQHKKGARP